MADFDLSTPPTVADEEMTTVESINESLFDLSTFDLSASTSLCRRCLPTVAIPTPRLLRNVRWNCSRAYPRRAIATHRVGTRHDALPRAHSTARP